MQLDTRHAKLQAVEFGFGHLIHLRRVDSQVGEGNHHFHLRCRRICPEGTVHYRLEFNRKDLMELEFKGFDTVYLPRIKLDNEYQALVPVAELEDAMKRELSGSLERSNARDRISAADALLKIYEGLTELFHANEEKANQIAAYLTLNHMPLDRIDKLYFTGEMLARLDPKYKFTVDLSNPSLCYSAEQVQLRMEKALQQQPGRRSHLVRFISEQPVHYFPSLFKSKAI